MDYWILKECYRLQKHLGPWLGPEDTAGDILEKVLRFDPETKVSLEDIQEYLRNLERY